jgi:hypothetical protein
LCFINLFLRNGKKVTKTETTTGDESITDTGVEKETKFDTRTRTDGSTETRTRTETKTETSGETRNRTKTRTGERTGEGTGRPPRPVRPKPETPKPRITPIFPFGGGSPAERGSSDYEEAKRRSDIDVNLGLEAIGQFARRQVLR